MYNKILTQLGPILYLRSLALNEQERKALFVCACNLIKEWVDGYSLSTSYEINPLTQISGQKS